MMDMPDQISEFYNAYWRKRRGEGRIHTDKGMWIPPRVQYAMELVQEEFPAAAPQLLDVGCGEGTLGMLFSQRYSGARPSMGIDVSEEAVRLAQPFYERTLAVNMEQDSARDRLPPATYDCIVCLEVMEHLFYPERALLSFASLLKPGGVLIASFPNIAWWRYRLDLLLGRFPVGYTIVHPSEHIQNFTLASFSQLLRDAGFEIEAVKSQKGLFPWLRPRRIFEGVFAAWHEFFGVQIVVKARVKSRHP